MSPAITLLVSSAAIITLVSDRVFLWDGRTYGPNGTILPVSML